MAKILSKISPKHKGVLCIISSAFCFAFMGAFVRLAGDLPSVQKSFFRNLVAFIFAAAILIRQKGSFLPQKKSNIGALLIRSVCGTLGILCNFYAVDHLALSDAAMLNKMSPFFVIVFSAMFLRERTNLVQTRCNSRICGKSAYNKAEPCKSGACAVTARFPRRYGRRCGLYGGKVARHQRRKRTLYRVLLWLLLPCNIAVPAVRLSRYDLAAVARPARCRTCGGRRSVQHHSGI